MLTDQQLLDTQTVTPAEVTPAVLAFCRAILADSGAAAVPVYVPVEPEPDVPLDQCFSTTRRTVEREGGSLQHGWTIWETKEIMLEAEFHGVWVSPNGRIVDVTPKKRGEKRILFLSDPVRRHDGSPRINWRIPLSHQPHVVEYLQYLKAVDKIRAGYGNPAEVSKFRLRFDKSIMRVQRELLARARSEQNMSSDQGPDMG